MKTIPYAFAFLNALLVCSSVGQAAPPAKTPPPATKRVVVPPMIKPVIKPVVKPVPQAAPTTGTITPTTTTAVTWTGTATGVPPGQMGESGATPGGNEDTFKLTVTGNASDYVGKTIAVRIAWNVPANDYDLYIHKANADGTDGQLVGSSANGAPSTEEDSSINPSTTGTGVYNINVIYFTVTPMTDQFTGTATLQAGATARSANYISGGITFSPNTPVKAATSAADGEPSSRCDTFGNYYVCGIRGVPAGVDLWYFDLRPTIANPANPTQTIANPQYDPNMRVPIYRGQPDAVIPATGNTTLSAGALGGGDIDLAVGFGSFSGTGASTTNPQPALAYASLTAANVTYGRSLDRGATFTFMPQGNLTGGVPVNDRQWMGFVDNNTVYLEYRNFAQGIAFAQQSTDGGLTYGAAVTVGMLPQTGALDVDLFDGTVYISGNNGQVAIGQPSKNPAPLNTKTNAPLMYDLTTAVPAGVNPANIFFPVRVAADHRNSSGVVNAAGTVYGCYSDGTNIFLVSSVDKGLHWAAPVQVNIPYDAANPTANPRTNLLPWLATGPTPGSVGIAWYGSPGINDLTNAATLATTDAASRYRVYYAQSFNALDTVPTFRVVQASDHTIHGANISLNGLVLMGTNPNRNLLDYFQINFDPTGAAVLGYTDDHNDFNGDTYVTRQISGPSINNAATNIPTPVEGSALPAVSATQPAQPGAKGEQVTDFAQDQDSGLLAVTPTNSPVDILSIFYTTQDTNTQFLITGTMTVSQLSPVPPSTTWRMLFAVNAPEAGVVSIPGNSYSKGVADRADQFYIAASTDASGAMTYDYGTAIRNGDGSMTYTSLGPADFGTFSPRANKLSVTIGTLKLNQYLNNLGHTPIAFGTVFSGLRGSAFETTSGGIALEDSTRGGTEFKIANPF